MNIINEFFVSFILIKLYFKFKVCRKIKFPLLWKFYFSKWKFYFSADSINYPKEIKIHDKTTSNFSHPENFVVFECAHRLLEKGYKAEHLELEPKWNLGRDKKGGKADILVKDNESNPYLIIECKTTDSKNSEFIKEWNRMQEDGGHLFLIFSKKKV